MCCSFDDRKALASSKSFFAVRRENCGVHAAVADAAAFVAVAVEVAAQADFFSDDADIVTDVEIEDL